MTRRAWGTGVGRASNPESRKRAEGVCACEPAWGGGRHQSITPTRRAWRRTWRAPRARRSRAWPSGRRASPAVRRASPRWWRSTNGRCAAVPGGAPACAPHAHRMRTACAPHVNVHRTRAACARQARAAAAEVRQEAKGAEPEVDPEAEAEAREAAEQEEAARRAEEQEAAREREAEAHLRGREEAVEAMQAELQQGVTARAYCEELQEPHAPHRTTPHRTAPRRAAPRRAAPHACDHTALDVHASRAAGSTSRYGTSIGAAGGVARGAR